MNEVERLPDLCCRCALPTERRETFQFAKQLNTDVYGLRSFGLWGRLLAKLTNRTRVRIAVPHCDACNAQARLAPRTVDFDEFTMQFTVHREFRRQVEARRGA